MKRWLPWRLRNKQCTFYIGGTVIIVLLILQCFNHWEVSRNRECLGDGPSHDKNTHAVRQDTVSLLEGQETIDYIAEYVSVKFKVLKNNPRDSIQAIYLTNTGIAVLRGGNWQIYFNHLYKMMHEKGGVAATGHVIHGSGFRLFHVKGSLYRLQPEPEVFRPLYPSETRTLILTGNYQQVAKTDSFPNWYVTSPGSTPRVLQSTVGESLDYVDNYNQSSWQWRRDPQEQNDPYTARVRFYMYANISHDLGRVGSLVLPTPEEADIDVKTLLSITPKDWVIISNAEFTSEAKYLADHCPIQFSYNFPKKRYIYLSKHPSDMNLSSEEYVLKVEPTTEIIQVYAEGKAGAFYGVQTILALLQREGNQLVIPKTLIRDKPRFPYRGIQLDVSRNFHSKETVMKLLDSMATYKLNKLHFHLSDDEGWRLEIPGLEELTQVGARRCHDTSEKSCLLPQLGSGPHTTSSGSGYYTLKDYREILMYAKKRHVQVIPEFDVPGHSRAAVKSMEARYKKYVPLDVESGGEFLLSEWDDKSNYSTAQSYDDGVLNVCIESTYTFLQHLIASVKELHQDVQPLDVVHIGGDEIAREAWTKSPACKTLTEERNITDFRFFFVHRVIELLQNQGLAAGVWEDGIIPKDVYPYNIKDLRNKQPSREIFAYAWNNIWEYGRSSRAITLANAGYKVVMAQATHLYFDHPYEPDPLERGLYWATRYIDTRKVFGFIPMHLLLNADVTGRGISLENTSEEKLGCLHKDTCLLKSPKNIVGLEANLWTETIRTNDQLQSMAFPRLLAMAERAWHKAPWEDILNKKERLVKLEADWITFSNTLGYRELRQLDQMGVKYRVPPPGALIVNNELRVNCLYPNLEIQYSSDGGKTWTTARHPTERVRKSGASKRPIKVYTDHNILVRTLSADGRRYSRVIAVNINKDI
ncbi:Beta-hexosaminidase [Mizuhopecten yessoensis]|uniref:beta-N-acetylhexosaminidase n=1 Tax=Mizuhopecten yessoensis TaxID=6573 RepID=A0A210QLI3_MIZYE|nr:Beta-hexosaminidase [Mizuhopecten yessoensis]